MKAHKYFNLCQNYLEVYKTDYLNSNTYRLAEVLAIIRDNAGNIGLIILSIDVEFSCEHKSHIQPFRLKNC